MSKGYTTPAESPIHEAENEAKLELAKNYLAKAELGGEGSAESGSEAVHKLIDLSIGGHAEATSLLNKCLDCDIGITENNRQRVLWCLQTSRDEKLLRLAAGQLYDHLTEVMDERQDRDSDEGDHVGGRGLTDGESRDLGGDKKSQDAEKVDDQREARLKRHLSEITDNKKQRKFIQKLATDPEMNRERFLDEVVKRLHGTESTDAFSELLDDATELAYKQSSLWAKLMSHKKEMLSSGLDLALRTVSKRGPGIIRNMVPTTQIQLLLLVSLYDFISVRALLYFLPVLVVYGAFVSALLATLQMFYAKKQSYNIRGTAEMLQRFNPVLVDRGLTRVTELDFRFRSLTSYAWFFSSVFFLVPSYGFAESGSFLYPSEMALFSFAFALVSTLVIVDEHPFNTSLAVLLKFLTSAPLFLDALPKLPQLSWCYSAAEFLFSEWFTVRFGPYISLNVGISSVSYVLLVCLLVYIIFDNGFSVGYKIALPICVSIVWWDLGVMFLHAATLYGLVRAVIGYTMITTFLPFALPLGALLLVYKSIAAVGLVTFFKLLVAVALLSLPALAGLWFGRVRKLGMGIASSAKPTMTKVAILVAICATVLPLFLLQTVPAVEQAKPLAYDHFAKHCGPEAWSKNGRAITQHRCRPLFGSKVDGWTAYVKDVYIHSVENKIQSAADQLPQFLADWVRCLYGIRLDRNCMESPDLCRLYGQQSQSNCTLANLNIYTLHVTATLPQTGTASARQEVVIEFGDSHRELAFSLKAGDELYVDGTLDGGLGADSTVHLSASRLMCMNRFTAITPGAPVPQSAGQVAARVAAFSLSFLTRPLLLCNATALDH